jgi:hypothetical protein
MFGGLVFGELVWAVASGADYCHFLSGANFADQTRHFDKKLGAERGSAIDGSVLLIAA